MTIATDSKRPPGRPREFDMDEALDRAIGVFSQRGYSGASISELKAAMQLAAGSLYKAFPDKRAIFLAVLDHYKSNRDALLRDKVASAVTGRDKVRALLSFYAEASLGPSGKVGCLIVASAAELALLDDAAAAEVSAALVRNHGFAAELIRWGHADGSIPAHVDAEVTGRALLSLGQGLRVLGKTGIAADDAAAVVETAMRLLD